MRENRMARWRFYAGLALTFACAGSCPAQSATSISLQRDGAVAIDGRVMRCGGVRNVLDPHLPNPVLAAPGIWVLNPGPPSPQSLIVRLIVVLHTFGPHHDAVNGTK